MQNRRIPIYVICGDSVQNRSDFYRRFCFARNPLHIQYGESDAPDNMENCFYLSTLLSPDAAGETIAQHLRKKQYDSIWVEWSTQPIDLLLMITRHAALSRLCTLKRILYCGDADALITAVNEPVTTQLLAQCDLLAVTQTNARELHKLRRRVVPLQPGIRVFSIEDPSEISAALKRRDAQRGLQLVLLAFVVAALFFILHLLNYTAAETMATFLGTYLQALPFLMLGILLSSAIQVFVPADLLQRIFPKKQLTGMLFGVLGGFMLPICDCASIPVFRSLVRKGVPLPAAVTFMIAAPIINPVVLLSTYYAFGGSVPIMLMRMGFGIVCSVIIGLCFVREKKSVFLAGASAPVCACGHTHTHDHQGEADAICETAHHHTHEHHENEEAACACACHHTLEHHTAGWKGKLTALLVHFQAEFFEVVRFLLIGVGVSTVLQLVMGSRIMNLRITNLAVSMLVMMALAFFLSLCSSSDAVVGKNMGASLPMGAVMSFMVFGPMIDVKNIILMSASFTKRFMIKLLIVTFLVSFLTVYLAFSLGLQGLIQ